MNQDRIDRIGSDLARASMEFQRFRKEAQQVAKKYFEAQQWLDKNVTPFVNHIQEMTPVLQEVQRVLQYVSPAILTMYQEIDKWNISSEVMSQAGWLPHYTTPFKDVSLCRKDIPKVRQLLLDYYQDNWPDVRSRIEERLSGYDLDNEAKEAMQEALVAHEQGLYRSVCRLLCPEIERVMRVERFANAVGQMPSTKLVQGLVDSQAPMETYTVRGLFDLTLLGYLTKNVIQRDGMSSDNFIYGLFESVTTPQERQTLEASAIPNRHAVIHGLVVYSSAQSSLNAIFMTDYIYQVLSDLKSSQP